jgi:hypothetical protein
MSCLEEEGSRDFGVKSSVFQPFLVQTVRLKKCDDTLTWLKWQFWVPLGSKRTKNGINSIFGGTPDTFHGTHECPDTLESISSTFFVCIFCTKVMFWQLFPLTFWQKKHLRTKKRAKNVDEIEAWCQLQQHSMYSFCARTCWRRKKILMT